jgi:hypothetical protein
MKFRQRNKNNGQYHYWGDIEGEWIPPKKTDNYIHPGESDRYVGVKNGIEIYESQLPLEENNAIKASFKGKQIDSYVFYGLI